MSVTRARVLESQERAKKATPLPLSVKQSTKEISHNGRIIARFNQGSYGADSIPEGWRNMEFFVAARSDVPDFAAALIEAMDALKESCTHSYRCICVGCELIRRFEGAE